MKTSASLARERLPRKGKKAIAAIILSYRARFCAADTDFSAMSLSELPTIGSLGPMHASVLVFENMDSLATDSSLDASSPRAVLSSAPQTPPDLSRSHGTEEAVPPPAPLYGDSGLANASTVSLVARTPRGVVVASAV